MARSDIQMLRVVPGTRRFDHPARVSLLVAEHVVGSYVLQLDGSDRRKRQLGYLAHDVMRMFTALSPDDCIAFPDVGVRLGIVGKELIVFRGAGDGGWHVADRVSLQSAPASIIAEPSGRGWYCMATPALCERKREACEGFRTGALHDQPGSVTACAYQATAFCFTGDGFRTEEEPHCFPSPETCQKQADDGRARGELTSDCSIWR